MALPVIAAGAARAAAVVGRAAVGAGKAAGSATKAGAQATGRATVRATQSATRVGQRTGTTGARRSFSQMRSQLQQARTRTQQLDRFRNKPPRSEEASEEDESENMDAPMQNLQATLQAFTSPDASRAAKFKMATSMLKQFHAMQAATPEEAKPTQDAAKKAVKKLIPKIALFIANSLASALELGTAGIAIILTFFIRFITLGWYNVEMIYGGWITKGKHKFIGPLTWDPIPMPFKKNDGGNALGPMLLVILADIFMIIVMFLPFIFLGVLASIFTSANPL